MSDIPITFLRLSVSLFMFAAKGDQGGIVQQQIETMRLRQWLSLVSAWLVERVCTETVRVREFIAPLPPTLSLKPATAKNSRADTNLSLLDPRRKKFSRD
jgi:hypothetical protein